MVQAIVFNHLFEEIFLTPPGEHGRVKPGETVPIGGLSNMWSGFDLD
jgi:hypothetical protein